MRADIEQQSKETVGLTSSRALSMNEDQEIADVVAQHGWIAQDVYDNDPPFMYSAGLMRTFNHPELIVFGLPSQEAHSLLASVVQSIREGHDFSKPCIRAVSRENGGDRQVGIRRVHPSQHPLYLGYAMGFVRHAGILRDLEALQIFWPDKNGKFPFDAGCDLDVHRLQPRTDIPLTPREIREFERQWE